MEGILINIFKEVLKMGGKQNFTLYILAWVERVPSSAKTEKQREEIMISYEHLAIYGFNQLMSERTQQKILVPINKGIKLKDEEKQQFKV